MDSISQKVAFLLEMFDDLNTEFIEHLVSNNPNYTLEQLVNQCLNENEKEQNESKQEILPNEPYSDMVSLIPASTQSYFNPQTNETNETNNNNTMEKMDIDHNSLLNTIPKEFHVWFEKYLNFKAIHKIIDIYTHLSLMTQQYTLTYSNDTHSNYDKIKMNELNKCIAMIQTLMKNINKSPNIDKYRRMRESNKSFQKKIAHVKGSKLLLSMLGWDYIKMDTENDGIYIFNSVLTIEWINIASDFMTFYVTQTQKSHKTVDKPMKIDEEFPIITDFPRKKLKPKNEKMGKKRRKFPKINKLSNALKNLGNINAQNLNAPNLRNELHQIAKKKARKRIFTMRDIEQLRKDEFERKAKGPKTSNELDGIGKEALRLTNEFRKQNGLSELKWHQSLCDIGKVHSQDMSEGKVPFGHQGFDERVRQYPFRPMSAAENVAMSNGLSNVAKFAVDGWIDSPRLRKNLLGNSNYCGIGVYRGHNGAYYLTQLFGLTNMIMIDIDEEDEELLKALPMSMEENDGDVEMNEDNFVDQLLQDLPGMNQDDLEEIWNMEDLLAAVDDGDEEDN